MFIQALKRNKLSIFWSYILVLIYFGIDRTIEYATDSYAALMMNDNWKVKIYENGRVLQGALYYLIELLRLPSGIKYQISYMSACLFLGLSIFLLSRIVDKYFRNEILSVIISFITIVNPFFVEFFFFIEKGMFCFVIFLNICALYMTEELFTEKKKDKRVVLSVLTFLCLMISVLMYQILISLYVVVCLAFIAINPEGFIKKNIYVMLMYVLPMMVAYILAKFVYPVERLSQRGSLSEAFRALGASIAAVSIGQFSYLRRGVFSVWLIILAAAVILFLIYEKKNLLKHLLCIMYEIAGCIVMSFAIVFLNDSEISPRVVYTYASIFGIVLIYVIAKVKENREENGIPNSLKVIIFVLLAGICIPEYMMFQKCFIERYRCNQTDIYLCNIIGGRIKEYEEKTGNKIDTLCYYSDQSRTWQDAGFDNTKTSVRAQATGWSRTNALNYYLGTDFVEGEPDPELTVYFKNINWDTYSEEQLRFVGNTLHICIY